MKKITFAAALLAALMLILMSSVAFAEEKSASDYLHEMESRSGDILPKFMKTYSENPDFIGQLTIKGTKIDYPIMYTPDEPHKYLYANFDGEYDKKGLPFIDESCTLYSDNVIIHGHNMKDNSMFGTLPDYAKKSYWEKYPTIQFDTLYEEREYEIMFAFRDRVYYKHEDVFKFYQFINAKDEADFEWAMENYREKALYDTGVTAEYGDKLLTLVTCAYHVENGRFVVVAKLKQE
ncbi:MAG: class B sortase [Clostridia bacterium]|nr:class B sortase [Clostridia bacterium]